MSDKEAQAAHPSQPKVFVRESTGLVKNVGFFDSIAMNMSNMSVGALLGVIGIAGLNPMYFKGGVSLAGVNLVYLSAIAFVVSFPQIIVYTVMTRRFPRTGGDYVWVSRIFGGPAGSILSFMGYTLETTAYLALIVLATVFAIGSVGLVFVFDPNLLGLAVPSFVPGSMPALQFVVGILIFGLLIAINILKPKAGFKLVSILTIFGMFAIVLAIAVLLMAGPTGVQNYINNPSGMFSVNGTQTYSLYSAGGAYSQGADNAFSLGSTVYLLPLMAAFVYPWLNASPAVASEIKGRSALKWNVPISSLMVFVFLTAAIGTMYYTAGQAFTNAAYASFPIGIDRSFNFYTLAMGVSGNQAIQLLIGLGWILANMSVLAYGVIVISRYLLAQSFDRFLPSRISNVSPRFGSPLTAHLVDLVVTLGLVGLAAFYYDGAGGLFGAILASMIYFIFVGLAAAVHGLRKEAGTTKAILLIAGVLNVGVFGFLSYQFLTAEDVWSLNNLTFGFIIASFLAGALIYLGSSWYSKKRGIDISLAYKELPPE